MTDTPDKTTWSTRIKVIEVDGPAPLKADNPGGTQILKLTAMCEDKTTKKLATFKKDLFQFLTTLAGKPCKVDIETATKPSTQRPGEYDDEGKPVAKKGTWHGGGGMSAEAAKVLADGFIKAAAIISLGNTVTQPIPDTPMGKLYDDVLKSSLGRVSSAGQASPQPPKQSAASGQPPKPEGQKEGQPPAEKTPQKPPEQVSTQAPATHTPEPVSTNPPAEWPKNPGQLLQWAVNQGMTRGEVCTMLGVTDITKIDVSEAYPKLYMITFGKMPDGCDVVEESSESAFDNLPSGSMEMDMGFGNEA